MIVQCRLRSVCSVDSGSVGSSIVESYSVVDGRVSSDVVICLFSDIKIRYERPF